MKIKGEELYFIPNISVGDLIDSEYNLVQECPLYISTRISPLLYQIQRISGYYGKYPEDIVQVVARHNKKKHPEYRKFLGDGFFYNGKKFIRFGKSASQSKQGITVFVSEKIYDELYKISSLDIPMWNKNVCISKYESYRCLIFSTCTFLNIPIPNICIVDSYSKIISGQNIRYVEELETTSKNGNVYKNKEVRDGVHDVKIIPWDGCGVSLHWIHEFAMNVLGLDYCPSALQIRLPFMKGLSVEFPFREWFAERGVTKIIDVFGKWHDVDKIDCIWNTDMWKGYKYFKSQYGNDGFEEYIKSLNKYEYKIGISKYSHHVDHLNLMTRMNFQYVQCLDLWNPNYMKHYDNLFSGENDDYDIFDDSKSGKVISLAKYSTDLFEKICGGSKFHMLKYMGVSDTDEDNITSAYVKSVLINQDMLKDPCVKRYVKRKAQKKINEMKIGKIYADGIYHTIFGDVIGYLEHCIGIEPVGVLRWGEFYADTIFENNQDVLSFRSPLVCPSEVNRIKIRNDLDDRWFGQFKGQDVAMINSYDLSMPMQGGCDCDGDSVFICKNKTIINSKIDKTIIVDIDDKVTAKEVEYNKENIIEYELNSRDERIGEITNAATSILNKYTNNKKIKLRYEDDVSLLRIYQGKEIDHAKTGVRPVLPKYIREHGRRVPYFLLYNYPQKLGKYFKTKEENKKLISEGKDKQPLNAYHSPSPLNELCEYVNRWEKKKLIWDDSQVNTGVLLINNKLKLKDESIMSDLRSINRHFCKEWYEYLKLKDEDDEIDLSICLNKYKDIILSKMKDRYLLANYFIKISYESINTNKILCWYIFSEEILKNLRKNSPIEKSTKIIENKDGEYEFLGKRYDMIEGECDTI